MVQKPEPEPVDVRALLQRLPPADVAARIAGDEDLVDAVFDVLLDIERWGDDGALEVAAVKALIAAGESDDVVASTIDLIEELHDDDEVAWALSRITFAVGAEADVNAGARVLDALDAALLDAAPTAAPTTAGAPGWTHLVDLAVDFRERGLDDERTWAWLERLRPVEPLLWCALSGRDPRAVPLLQALADDAAAALDGNGNGKDGAGRLAAADLLVEAVAALELHQQVRDIDRARLERAEAIRKGH